MSAVFSDLGALRILYMKTVPAAKQAAGLTFLNDS